MISPPLRQVVQGNRVTETQVHIVPNKTTKTKVLFLLCLALGLFGFIMILGNQFNATVQRSERFTIAKFMEITEGDSIEKVISSLGEPIEIKLADPEFSSCKDCSYYYFEGNPADWLISYREAWVIVKPDGIVKQRILHAEP